MDPRIIKTEQDYEEAVAEIEALMERPESDDDAAEKLELLALLVQKYEDENFPVGDVSPAEVVTFVMESRGLAQKDLAPLFGSAARVSDFLAGRRGLSFPTIVNLNRELHIPFEALIDKSAARKPRGQRGKPKRARARHSKAFASSATSVSRQKRR